MKCPRCNKEMYIVRMRKGDKVEEHYYCSFDFVEGGLVDKQLETEEVEPFVQEV